MSLTDLKMFTALGEKMRWHQTRQGLLAENVANAETPRFRGRDLKAFGFEEHMRNLPVNRLSGTRTNPAHIEVSSPEPDEFGARNLNNFEITPEGNGITLEDEMMKVAANQMDYQTVTSLYTRSVRLIRTALGRQG